jgi:hypothetical protein
MLQRILCGNAAATGPLIGSPFILLVLSDRFSVLSRLWAVTP